MIDSKECTHKTTIKAGKHYQRGKIRQKLLCKDCGMTILGEVIG